MTFTGKAMFRPGESSTGSGFGTFDTDHRRSLELIATGGRRRAAPQHYPRLSMCSDWKGFHVVANKTPARERIYHQIARRLKMPGLVAISHRLATS